jgi:hypothetical protein
MTYGEKPNYVGASALTDRCIEGVEGSKSLDCLPN